MIQKLTIGRGLLFLSLSTGFAMSQLAIAAAPPIAQIKHRRPIESRYGVPTFADSALGDITAEDDPIVRQAKFQSTSAG